MKKEKKPTKMQEALLAEARKRPVGRFREADGWRYRFTDGKEANGRIVANCIRAGWLIANGDGLLPGFTQTYSPRP